MKNMPSSASGGSSEFPEKVARKIDAKHYTPGTSADQLLLDYLIDQGFTWEEAITLLTMREHLYENKEMKQRIEGDYRMHFVRWLHESGEISDW